MTGQPAVQPAVRFRRGGPREDIVAEGVCTRRGRSLNFAQVVVTSELGQRLAEGMLTVNVSGRRSSAP